MSKYANYINSNYKVYLEKQIGNSDFLFCLFVTFESKPIDCSQVYLEKPIMHVGIFNEVVVLEKSLFIDELYQFSATNIFKIDYYLILLQLIPLYLLKELLKRCQLHGYSHRIRWAQI